MDESKVELRYVYTRESYLAATKDYQKIFPEPLGERLEAWLVFAVFIIVGVLPSLFNVWLYTSGPEPQFTSWILWLSVAVLAYAGWTFFRWLRVRLKSPAGEYFDKDDRWKGERRGSVDDRGTHYEDSLGQSSYKWATYHSVIETSTAYLFTYGRKENPAWFYVPKYAFTSPQQEELFRSIVGRNVELKKIT